MKTFFQILLSVILIGSVSASSGEQKELENGPDFAYVLVDSDMLLRAKIQQTADGKYRAGVPLGIDEEYVRFRCVSDVELTVEAVKALIERQGYVYTEDRCKKEVSLLTETTIESVVTLELLGLPDSYYVKATTVHNDLRDYSSTVERWTFFSGVLALFLFSCAFIWNYFIEPVRSIWCHLLFFVWALFLGINLKGVELFWAYLFWYLAGFLTPFVIALIVKFIQDWRLGDEPRHLPV